MTVVELPRKKGRRRRIPRDVVPLSANSGPGRFFAKMCRDIRDDLGGTQQITRVADELIEAFCGCATALRFQTHQILLGDAELDMTAYATLASTMLRIGGRLALERHVLRDVSPPTIDEIAADIAARKAAKAIDEDDPL
jgi:hypothetical protein